MANNSPVGVIGVIDAVKPVVGHGVVGAGQQGIIGASGLNNIGLLICTWGQVTSTGAGYFVIDDGSEVDVKCVVPAGVTPPSIGDYVGVTGISSCEMTGDDLYRLLRVRAQEDIVAQ